jgi:TatD DNase family protein
MNYIDIHTHTYYQDPETTLLLNAFPEEQNKWELPVYVSVGLHPWHVQEDSWQKQVERVENAVALHKNILAVGEAGLDKVVSISYNIQQKAFAAQLSVAESAGKPMIIHCVRAYSELLSLRKRSDQSIPWIFHWFNADEQIAHELIRKNCYLSFGHMLFNDRSKAFMVYKTLSPDRLFFETDDAGYTIEEVYAKAAEIRNLSVSDLKNQIINNFERCFQL